MKNIALALLAVFIISCNTQNTGTEEPDVPYILCQEDVKILGETDGGFEVLVGQLLRVEVVSLSDENVDYSWLLDGNKIAATKNLEYMMESAGVFELTLVATQGEAEFYYPSSVRVIEEEVVEPQEDATAYITQVLDYMPAAGQYTNKLPLYEDGDTQQSINEKVLSMVGNNNQQTVSLGGYGGYIVVGFDHTIENKEGLRDFRVTGNAFYGETTPQGGSCEAGIIMVAYDANKNGVPDDDEWYEIAGSAHNDPTAESWYSMALEAGNDMNFYSDYSITYYKPESEPQNLDEFSTYIRWVDNKGGEGYIPKSTFYTQPYFPEWVEDNSLTFSGSRLPQNGIETSSNNYVLYKFEYGYADNDANSEDGSAIDISWAVDANGNSAGLTGVDFIKIYTGVNQVNGWVGECSTEFSGIEDLHILGIEIGSEVE